MSRTDHEPKIVSNSTILILSGILIGMSLDHLVGSELTPFLMAAGVSGFLAFLVLDLAATRRLQDALKIEQAQIEDRLDRHTQSLSSVGFTLKAEDYVNDSTRVCTFDQASDLDANDQLIASA